MAHTAAAVKVCLVDIISWLRGSLSNSSEAPRIISDDYPAKRYTDEIELDVSIEQDAKHIPGGTPVKADYVDAPRDTGTRILGDDSQDGTLASSRTEPPAATQVRSLGTFLYHSFQEVKRKHPNEMDSPTRQAMADHFWCELLAQLAHEIDQGLSVADNVPDYVADRIIQCREKEKRDPVGDQIVKSAVRATWKRIQRLSTLGILAKSRAVRLIIRILAMLVCKQPERHQAVVQYCIDPFRKQLLMKTKERLISVFHEWLPDTKNELGMQNFGGSVTEASP